MKKNDQNNIYLSLLLHAGFVVFLFLFTILTKKKFNDTTYVEVSFGLNENLVQTEQMNDPKQPEGERVATKAFDALPQLTKNSAPKLETSSSKPEETLKIKDSTAKPKDTTKASENIKFHNEKTGNLELKDFLKRKEETLRKVGDHTQTGQKEIGNKKIGLKHSLDEIPKSPFSTLQKGPHGDTPTGIETGKNTQSIDIYKTYLRNQLKSKWNLPEISSFPSSLMTIVSFTINETGDLIGNPRIIESSHNMEFDKMVLEAVKATFPVSLSPPKDLNSPQTFLAKYSSKDVH